jgi:hypothetical protein
MSRLSRREFARAATLVAGAALLPRHVMAQAETDVAPVVNAAPLAAPKLAAAAQAEVDARVQTIVARFGARLSPADRANVAAVAANLQGALDAVRAVDVADEPAVVFRASRKLR